MAGFTRGLALAFSQVDEAIKAAVKEKEDRERALTDKEKKFGKPIVPKRIKPDLTLQNNYQIGESANRGINDPKNLEPDIPIFTTEQIKQEQEVERFLISGKANQLTAEKNNTQSIFKAFAVVSVLGFLMKKFG